MNFAIHFLLLTRRFREALSSDELRFFLGVVGLSTLVVFCNIYRLYPDAWSCFRSAFFQVCSIISTTGYATADYGTWPQLAQIVMILLMICGACAGSTGGGVKCSRVLICYRCLRREIHHVVHPREVQVVKLDGKAVEESTLRSVLIFTVAYFAIAFGAALVVALDNFSFATTFSAALTCISNTGPGLEMVGPSGNFSAFSPVSKLVLSFCMIVGRLEILPVLILFSRSAWRRL